MATIEFPVNLHALFAVNPGYPGDQSGPQQNLISCWAHGKGAAQIAWGTHGDHTRCVKLLGPQLPAKYDVHGMCNNLEKYATGRWSANHVRAEKGH